MFDLDTFYHSKEWLNLTRYLRLERVGVDGYLTCWHCGKPIVNAYDAICHHTIFLTEENVNNTEISLNPNLIKIVHHKCHNHIHNKLGYVRPEVYLVYGSPLSGKSSYVDSVIVPGDLLIDIDKIWQAVSGQTTYSKPKTLNPVVFGIRDYLLDSVRMRRGRWNNAYIVGGYPLISERERICRALGAREIYIESTREECIARLAVCEDERKEHLEEWEGYINEWWRRYAPDET